MLTPKSEAELSDALKSASSPLRIIGGGTRPIGRSNASEMLSTSKLTGIELYEPGALTIVAKAGTPIRDIEAALAKENQRLPFEPMDHRALLGTKGEPTIGGVVAANVSGPRRIQAGACRDSLIGVRFVDGAGTALKNGGRVMKNVTGYDLVKLMAGSYGTLGVLSEVGFKVLPGIAATATVTLHHQQSEGAIAAMSKALGSPFEVSAAAFDPASGSTHLRLEGFGDSVVYRTAELTKLLGDLGDITTETNPDKSKKLWADIRDVKALTGTEGNLWRISVKPSDGAKVASILGAVPSLMDWGGGLIWAAIDPAIDLRTKLAGIQGHATLIRGEGFATFHPEPAPLAAVVQGLRDKFDPKGLLNPGLMSDQVASMA
jgi:glycolate oxidase FAD binding subunit